MSSLTAQHCTASQSEIDFGELDTSDPSAEPSARATWTVSNFTPVDLRLRTSALSPPFFTAPPRTALLRAGDTFTFELRFQPTGSLLHFDQFELLDEGDGSCALAVKLQGRGSGGLSVDTQPIDLGFVEPGQTKTVEVRVNNTRREATELSFLQGALR